MSTVPIYAQEETGKQLVVDSTIAPKLHPVSLPCNSTALPTKGRVYFLAL